MATKKLFMMAKHTASSDQVLCYFMGDQESIELFWQDAGIEPFPSAILDAEEFIHVTEGSFPTILFLENGRIVHRSGYRDFTDWHLRP
jgi:hypothetical protein